MEDGGERRRRHHRHIRSVLDPGTVGTIRDAFFRNVQMKNVGVPFPMYYDETTNDLLLDWEGIVSGTPSEGRGGASGASATFQGDELVLQSVRHPEDHCVRIKFVRRLGEGGFGSVHLLDVGSIMGGDVHEVRVAVKLQDAGDNRATRLGEVLSVRPHEMECVVAWLVEHWLVEALRGHFAAFLATFMVSAGPEEPLCSLIFEEYVERGPDRESFDDLVRRLNDRETGEEMLQSGFWLEVADQHDGNFIVEAGTKRRVLIDHGLSVVEFTRYPGVRCIEGVTRIVPYVDVDDDDPPAREGALAQFGGLAFPCPTAVELGLLKGTLAKQSGNDFWPTYSELYKASDPAAARRGPLVDAYFRLFAGAMGTCLDDTWIVTSDLLREGGVSWEDGIEFDTARCAKAIAHRTGISRAIIPIPRERSCPFSYPWVAVLDWTGGGPLSITVTRRGMQDGRTHDASFVTKTTDALASLSSMPRMSNVFAHWGAGAPGLCVDNLRGHVSPVRGACAAVVYTLGSALRTGVVWNGRDDANNCVWMRVVADLLLECCMVHAQADALSPDEIAPAHVRDLQAIDNLPPDAPVYWPVCATVPDGGDAMMRKAIALYVQCQTVQLTKMPEGMHARRLCYALADEVDQVDSATVRWVFARAAGVERVLPPGEPARPGLYSPRWTVAARADALITVPQSPPRALPRTLGDRRA
jgi:hypothetical protein